VVRDPRRLIDPTVASTFRIARRNTLLIDEVDNMSIVGNMKSVLNAWHSYDGSVPRTGKDGEVKYHPVYGPVALAGIGRLPATLMSRSIIIRLHRSAKPMERFKAGEQFYAPQLAAWADQTMLDPSPQMPTQLVGRDADNWRPLIPIADHFGHGQLGRNEAVFFMNEGYAPDIKESVIRDIQKVFNRAGVKILTAGTLYEKQIGMKKMNSRLTIPSKKYQSAGSATYLLISI
jgi:hypothetical protein